MVSYPSAPLSLATAARLPLSPPNSQSWTPVGSSSCSLCRLGGIAATSALELRYDEEVIAGPGNIVIDRGGGMSLLRQPATDTSWFDVAGTRLRIQPPAQEKLGGSGGCTRVNVEAKAIQDADGGWHNQPATFTVCIADTVAPVVSHNDPPNNTEISADQTLVVQVQFSETVEIPIGAPSATLVPVKPVGSQVFTVDLTDSSAVELLTTSNSADTLRFQVEGPLEYETSYELRLKSGSVADIQGNLLPTSVVLLHTACAAPCSSAVTATIQSEAAEESGLPVALLIGLVLLAIVAGAGIFVLWKRYVQNLVEQREAPESKVAPQSPGWGAKPSPTATWASNSSGEYSASARSPASQIPASRVTAPVNNAGAAGPRQAGWANSGDKGSGGAGGDFRANPPGMPVPGENAADRATAAAAAQKNANWGRQRSREAEDMQDRSRRPPGAAAPKGQSRSHTDDAAMRGGWVQSVDANTGQTFWYHYKTQEKRWDPPPRVGASAATPPRAQQQKAPPREAPRGPTPEAQQQQAPPKAQDVPGPLDTSSLEHAEEIARVKAEVSGQLEKTHKESIASRKKTFKFLCLQWHPDKNQDNMEVATAVFQYVQAQKDWYLKE